MDPKLIAAHKRILQLERDLLHARKLQALGLLASGMAHDFNNVLSAITGYSELLRKRFGVVDPDITRYSEVILESCTRASAMVDRLKLFTRKDRRKETLLDAHQLMSELRDVVSFTMPSRYKISWDFGAVGHWLSGDPGLFQGAILHLLILAREALPKGGNITIRTSNLSARIGTKPSQPVLILDMVSSDEKLDWSVLEKVLKVKKNFESVSDTDFAGLSVVSEYLDSQGGALQIERVGQDSLRVRLMFPLSLEKDPNDSLDEENHSVLSPSTPVAPVAPKVYSLLIVDDEPDIRAMLAAMLQSPSVRCYCCDDFQGAKAYLQQGLQFHAALIDQNLDGDDGLSICEWMQRHSPGTRLGLMTGLAVDLDIRVLQTRGISLFEKPFDVVRLKAWAIP